MGERKPGKGAGFGAQGAATGGATEEAGSGSTKEVLGHCAAASATTSAAAKAAGSSCGRPIVRSDYARKHEQSNLLPQTNEFYIRTVFQRFVKTRLRT